MNADKKEKSAFSPGTAPQDKYAFISAPTARKKKLTHERLISG